MRKNREEMHRLVAGRSARNGLKIIINDLHKGNYAKPIPDNQSGLWRDKKQYKMVSTELNETNLNRHYPAVRPRAFHWSFNSTQQLLWRSVWDKQLNVEWGSCPANLQLGPYRRLLLRTFKKVHFIVPGDLTNGQRGMGKVEVKRGLGKEK